MKYLIFDTETTGFIQKGLPLTDPSQPRILQLAAVMIDSITYEHRNILSIHIAHDNLIIPEGAKSVHGIDEKRCELYGVTESYALHIFERFFSMSDQAFAYNARYDVDVISSALLRLNRNDFAARLGSTIDIMEPLTNIIQLPGKFGKFKWPKLEEAFYFYFDRKPPVSHDALADVHATIQILKAYNESQHGSAHV